MMSEGGVRKGPTSSNLEDDGKKESWRDREAAFALTCLSDSSSPANDADKTSVIKSLSNGNGKGKRSRQESSSTNELTCDGFAIPQKVLSRCSTDNSCTKNSTENHVNGEHHQAAPVKAGFAKTFPEKLHDMLEREENNDAIRWLSHGKAFAILNRRKLGAEVLPRHGFKKCKFGSFTRRLYLWGFRKITTGDDVGAFRHDLFQEGDRMACLHMKCRKPLRSMPEEGGSSEDIKPAASSALTPEAAMSARQASGSLSQEEGNRSTPVTFSENEDDDEDDLDDENDEDYYDRAEAAPQVGFSHPAASSTAQNGSVLDPQPPQAAVGSAESLSGQIAALQPHDIISQQLRQQQQQQQSANGNAHSIHVDHIDLSNLSLQSLLGVTDSPIMHLYQAAAESNIDRDALTEILLYHHQKKLFLRTALLSDMVRSLASRKAAIRHNQQNQQQLDNRQQSQQNQQEDPQARQQQQQQEPQTRQQGGNTPNKRRSKSQERKSTRSASNK